MPVTIDQNSLPAHVTVGDSLNAISPFKHHWLKAQNTMPLLKLDIQDLNLEQLIKDTVASMEQFGSWNYRIGMQEGQVKHDAGYGGIGLTYNPTHTELTTADIHEQVQGNPLLAGTQGPGNPFSGPRGNNAVKNSYYDTYGLAYRTPASRYRYLGTFLDRCQRTMVRSAVRIIYAENEGPVRPGEGRYAGVTWHTDEPMFENLRVNIPLVTDPIFVLEQQGHAPVHLEAGYAYSWDTNIRHRAYATKKEHKHRIHLMLGFSCWWDFDENTATWTQNEYFGKMHPKDMLASGLVISGVAL